MSQPESEPTDTPFDPIPVLAAELNLPRASVSAVVQLLAESSTVPFIARYRKEATGGLTKCRSEISKSAAPTWSKWRHGANRS